MTPSKISSTKSAAFLALALAAAGQAPGNVPSLSQQQSRAEQSPAQQTNTTKAPSTTGQRSAQSIAIKGGRGRDRRQAYNPIRRARRRLEQLGIITSGRQWRNFRKYARHNPIVAEFWLRTLNGEV